MPMMLPPPHLVVDCEENVGAMESELVFYSLEGAETLHAGYGSCLKSVHNAHSNIHGGDSVDATISLKLC